MSKAEKQILLTQHKDSLNKNWSLFRSNPNQYTEPADYDINNIHTSDAIVPGTIAMAVNGSPPQCWSPDIDYDNYDWWYQHDFEVKKTDLKQKKHLCFDGLATLCDIWLNNEKILTTDNMFRAYRVEISHLIRESNNLILVFRSVTHNLKEKRPRPRWKTKLVENQQMRWIRSTVLGHVSAWTPPIKAVGPWKNIYIETSSDFDTQNLKIVTSFKNNTAKLKLKAELLSGLKIDKAEIKIDNTFYTLSITQNKNSSFLECDISAVSLRPWMPHTHGDAKLYKCEIILTANKKTITIDQREIGFKSCDFKIDDSQSALFINDQLIFCRGTCWTVSDYLSLNSSFDDLKKHLTLLRDAGLNMIRVGGTMIYENDDFYKLCDQLGIMVWQDFMFASMDYPVDDSDFLENIKAEVDYQLKRLSKHVCISTYCGNTDIEAQAAMFGIHEDSWSNSFFHKSIPERCQRLHPGIPYLASSPTGGTLPFHLSSGVSHYWGIGAYMHTLPDNDMARVRFASEGMGLSHIPEDETIQECTGKNTLFPFHNEWATRIPRDLGAGWDFDSIRDSYLKQLFNLDPLRLRRQNVEKYIELSRVVSGEVITQVFQHWRSTNSQCNGGLVWFNRDFWPSAGFGLIDSNNHPKAAYYQLKNIWRNQLVILKNEGLDGANVSLINETSEQLTGNIEIILLKDNETVVAQATQKVKISPNTKQLHSVDKILGHFYDTGYAYKFGQPQFDIMICRLKDHSQSLIHEAFMFIENYDIKPADSAIINATAKQIDQDTLSVTIVSDKFLQFVRITARNYQAEDNYFHLSPNCEKTIKLNKISSEDKKFRGQIEATNINNSIKIKLHD